MLHPMQSEDAALKVWLYGMITGWWQSHRFQNFGNFLPRFCSAAVLFIPTISYPVFLYEFKFNTKRWKLRQVNIQKHVLRQERYRGGSEHGDMEVRWLWVAWAMGVIQSEDWFYSPAQYTLALLALFSFWPYVGNGILPTHCLHTSIKLHIPQLTRCKREVTFQVTIPPCSVWEIALYCLLLPSLSYLTGGHSAVNSSPFPVEGNTGEQHR